MTERPRAFPHRANVDGTFDAICPNCLKTVSSAPTESLLGPEERNHACNPIEVEYLWGAKPFYAREQAQLGTVACADRVLRKTGWRAS